MIVPLCGRNSKPFGSAEKAAETVTDLPEVQGGNVQSRRSVHPGTPARVTVRFTGCDGQIINLRKRFPRALSFPITATLGR
jgi:hypothetical protein